MNLGVDYSDARPGGAALKAAGYNFACRYLASYEPKRITAPERDDLHNNGLGIVLVFEDFATNALGGDVQGVKDAQEALAQANAIGFPANLPIYFAVDFDASEAQQPLIDAYLNAAGTIIGAGRVGIYGGFYVVKRCLDNGSARWAWQTLAWSGGQIDPRVHIYQNGQSAFNGGCDVDEARQSDYGQWGGTNDMATPLTQQQVLDDFHAYRIKGDGPGGEPTQAQLDFYSTRDPAVMYVDFITYMDNEIKSLESQLVNQPASPPIQDVTPPPTKPLPGLDPLPIPTPQPLPPPDQAKVNIFVALWRALFG